ncbi:MAG: hypothetical protein GY863_15160, partial [bacterium]|nr:hypothetical protein [bacterium]
MKYNSRITLISVFIFILGLCCSPGREEISRDFSKRDAEELLSSYVKTFVEEDSTALLKYWSTISSEKESFRMMLFYIGGIGPYSYWKNFLGSYTYEIDGIDHGESFHIINMR